MNENQVSLTAIMTAYCRSCHSLNDDPKIFDDFLAYHLIPEDRRALIEQGFAMACSAQNTTITSMLQVMGLPNVLSRARFTEDHLEEAVKHGVQQYVILGAGMDTFAFRRLDLQDQLQVFEIDHPATQSFKRNRLAELKWIIPDNLHFVPIDFTKESLEDVLRGKLYDPHAKSFFSWLGVTMYLTREEVFATLRSIANIAPSGSMVAFDYFEPDKPASHQQEMWRKELQKIGEPVKTGFCPSTLAADLTCLGLRLRQDLGPSNIQEFYFRRRTDGYCASENAHIAMAVVD